MPTKGGMGKEAGAVETEVTGEPVTPVAGDGLAAWFGELVGQETGNADLSFDTDDVDDSMVLSLSDLLPDANGDVVMFSEAGPVAVNITTDERITETGTADHYVTSTGVDVSGYHFCTFEAGLTIYYPSEIDLLVMSQSS